MCTAETLGSLAKAHANLMMEPVSLKLPRFRVRYAIELSRAIGAPAPFIDDLADFSGLTSSGEK